MEQLFDILLLLNRGTPRHGEWVVACLQGIWPKLLGDRLAAVCRPACFEGSELVVKMLDSCWEEAVRSVQPVLLEKVRAATAGEVKAIRVVNC